jgi:hypothetical protein
VLVFVTGCGADAGPTRADCADFLDHARGLGRLLSVDDDQFAARCPAIVTRKQVRCGLAADDVEAFDRCLDVDKMLDRMDRVGMETLVGKRPQDRVMTELARIRDDACACKDKPCADQVEQDFDAWSKRYANIKGSPAEAEQATKLMSDMSDCIVKAQQE